MTKKNKILKKVSIILRILDKLIVATMILSCYTLLEAVF